MLPLQSLGQGLLQVGGGCWERELDCDAAAVVEDGGEVVSFRGGQDGQLVVRLTCRTHTEASHAETWLLSPAGRFNMFILPNLLAPVQPLEVISNIKRRL